jgi:LuxR family transcriptional regulator, quorum-sensing system regulator BjaR1
MDEAFAAQGSADTPLRVMTPQDLFYILARIDACKTPECLRTDLLECLLPFGFKGFTIAVDRKLKSISVHAALLATWPKDTNEAYVSSGLFHKDPVMVKSHTAIEAFVWDMSVYDASDPDHRQLMGMRRALGVDGGIVVPVMENMGGRTVLFISGVNFPKCKETLLMLRLIVQHVVARLNLFRTHNLWTEPHTAFVKESHLSPRERQVLGWIAFGKSSRDVAAIMGISEYTVNEHIASAVDKLNASNRTEAVMRAVLMDDIELN